VKVGDLVRFKDVVKGMEGITGVIIDENGYDAWDVCWSTGKVEVSLESFLEKVDDDESR